MMTSAPLTSKRMPVLFLGHGSPMNALADNVFTKNLRRLGREVPRPRAILCVSAHWMTQGSWVTHMRAPRTIHDFSGFPKALFDVQYPAPGQPEVAELVAATVGTPKINSDDEMWGLDHGTWSVLRHMYPEADVPVVQLSVDLAQPSEYHYQLGQQLRVLRDQGILIVGSGNVVHNLRQLRWEDNAKPFDWAVEFDAWVREKLVSRDYAAIVSEATQSKAGQLAVPTPDHWYPLLYALGASEERDELRFEHEGIDNGSISMRCLSLGMG